MKGTRPLTNDEIIAVRDAFTGTYLVRDRGLFMLGVSVGGRISELLALTISDVWQNDRPVSDLVFGKDIVKGKEESRTVPVNVDGAEAIRELYEYLDELHSQKYGKTVSDVTLFPSRNGGGLIPMTRQNADMALKKAFIAAGLNGKIATHSLRKSFAQRLYNETNDIFVVKEMLGHKNVATTQSYLGIDYIEVRQALDNMSIVRFQEGSRRLEKEPTVDLINELIVRGYTVASLETLDNEVLCEDDEADRQMMKGTDET